MGLTENRQGTEPDGGTQEKPGILVRDEQDKLTPERAGMMLGRYAAELTPVRVGLLLVFVSFLIITAIFFFSGTPDSGTPDSSSRDEFTYPRNVLDHKILANGTNTELDLTVKLQGWDAGAGDMYAAIVDMENVMKHELQQSSGEQGIVFHIVGDTGGGYDDYGRARPTRLINVFDIQYSMDNLKQIDWSHLPSEMRLLNLGLVSGVTPAGADVGKAYCEKDGEYSQVFCANF
jgi:hypothetical protein